MSASLPTRAALGPMHPRSPVARRRLVVVMMTLVLIASLAKPLLAGGRAEPPPLPVEGSSNIAPRVFLGPQPSEADLQRLVDAFGVRMVVDLGPQDLEQQAVARDLHIEYVPVPHAVLQPLAPAQLTTLVVNIESAARAGVPVYVEDETGDSATLRQLTAALSHRSIYSRTSVNK